MTFCTHEHLCVTFVFILDLCCLLVVCGLRWPLASFHCPTFHRTAMQTLRGLPCTHKCASSFSGSRQLVRVPIEAGSRRSAQKRSRAAVVVEANLFSRAVRVIQSYANQIGEF